MNPARSVFRRAQAAARRVLPEEGNVDHCGADRGTQLALTLAWSQYPNLAFRDVEFRNNSQNGEDGILLYLFSLAGHGSRRAVEMCAGDGIESNSANLVLHHDWDALMLDGNDELLAKGTAFYAGLVAKYWFERFAKLPVEIDIASEFRYRGAPLEAGDLAIFISQSG